MTKSAMCIDLALPEQRERLLQYKVFAVALSYPDEKFFEFFKENLLPQGSKVSFFDWFLAFCLPNFEIDKQDGEKLEQSHYKAVKSIFITFTGKEAGEKFTKGFFY